MDFCRIQGGVDRPDEWKDSLMQDRDFEALEPFFQAILRMTADVVDGDDFFACLADDCVWEYGFVFAGTIGRVEGRDAIREHFRGYHHILWLDAVDHDIVHPLPDGLVLEYRSRGRGTQTGKPYNNQYVSILTVRDRKIVNWRDYSNKLAVLETVGEISAVATAMGSAV